jgi:hypothetical protein
MSITPFGRGFFIGCMPSPITGTLVDKDLVVLFVNPVIHWFGSLDIEIWTLFGFWCLYFGIWHYVGRTGRPSNETTPKWHCFLLIKLDAPPAIGRAEI